MEIIEAVLLLLISALILGELCEKLHVPAVAGEILAGVILGPALLNVIIPTDFLHGFSEIALFFIVLLLGIDEETQTLTRNYLGGIGLSVSGFLFPVAIMYIIAVQFLGLSSLPALFLSISVGIPSISITSVLIRQYSLSGTRVGKLIVSSVVISDVTGFVIVSLASNPQALTIKLLGTVLLLVAVFALDFALRSRSSSVAGFLNRLHAAQRGPKVIFGTIIVFSLFVSFILDLLGITYVLGAFFAGILVSDVSFGAELKKTVRRTMSRMESSFFGPLFFSIAGLDMIIPGIPSLKYIAYLLPVTAVAGGILVFALARRLVGKKDAAYVTGILGSRGAVGIVIATIGLNQLILPPDLYTIAMFSTVLLSLVIPVAVMRRGVFEEKYGTGND